MTIRYKVITYGGMRGLEFPDLLIKYSTGYSIPLSVHQDEYVPLEILDPLDVKKSLIAGSLGRYIAAGQVKVEGDELGVVNMETRPRQVIVPAVQQVINEPTNQEVQTLPQPNPKVEPPKIIEPQITNLSDVKELKDFDRLSFYLKKRFLRESQDKALLLRIYQTTTSDSFKIQIKQRLRDFA
jgi:hypothetical protein